MGIKTYQQSIKILFEQNPTFQVPKYQRGYAWDEEAIEDFVEDIFRCLETRINGTKRHHFFGGVVTTRNDIQNSSRSNYEVIDGQQRLASFVMLVAVIIRSMEELVANLVKKDGLSVGEKKARTYLTETIDTLKALYLYYRDNIELEYVEVPKLTLAYADNEFFQGIIAGREIEPTRASHERISAAWLRLQQFMINDVLGTYDAPKKATIIQQLVNGVLAEDCTVIFMCSDTRTEAYQIFQVLNDRGVNLTDGDLLRARTLELLDDKKLSPIQDQIANSWDRVLAYPPGDIDSYLRWYFSSFEGRRPKSSDLADQFLNNRFKCVKNKPLTKTDGAAILKEVKSLDDEFALLRTLSDGDWPYSDHSTVKSWDRERLRMLVIHLKHTNALPLLLALRALDAKKFAEAVAIIERFVFRYKTIGNAHIGPATEIYLKHSKKIRESSSDSIKSLRSDLRMLINRAVPDSVFEANLREIKYSTRGGNGHIRYLLITLEDYLQWYEQGAQGIPKCKDKSRIFDFSNTTLEHIYPQSVEIEKQHVGLEKVKHTIGNLTIFGPDDNDKLANKPFPEKRIVLSSSHLRLNREIGKYEEWTSEIINERTDRLVSIALKVFMP